MFEALETWVNDLILEFKENKFQYILNVIIVLVIAWSRQFFTWSKKQFGTEYLNFKKKNELITLYLKGSNRFREKVLVQIAYDAFTIIILCLAILESSFLMQIFLGIFALHVLIFGLGRYYYLWSKVQNEEFKSEIEQIKEEYEEANKTKS